MRQVKVVLLQEVQGIGGPGTVKDVSDGYARNYLLPRKLATPATASALKQVEQLKAANDRRQAKQDAQAAALAGRVEGQELYFRVRAGEEGRLYGSVTNVDIADALEREGLTVDRRTVLLEEPIKELGVYRVPIRLHPEVRPEVKIWVVAED